jgi:hypothetical protein
VKKKDPALAKVKVKKKKFKKKPKRRCTRGVLTDYFPLGMMSLLKIKSDFRGTGWSGIIQGRWQGVLDKREEDIKMKKMETATKEHEGNTSFLITSLCPFV